MILYARMTTVACLWHWYVPSASNCFKHWPFYSPYNSSTPVSALPHILIYRLKLYCTLDLKLENVLFVHSTTERVTVQHKGKTCHITLPVNPRIKCKLVRSQTTWKLTPFPLIPGVYVWRGWGCTLGGLVIDFGGATYEHENDKSRVINTRQYRGPEVILELNWS
jgi:hypothetical protein